MDDDELLFLAGFTDSETLLGVSNSLKYNSEKEIAAAWQEIRDRLVSKGYALIREMNDGQERDSEGDVIHREVIINELLMSCVSICAKPEVYIVCMSNDGKTEHYRNYYISGESILTMEKREAVTEPESGFINENIYGLSTLKSKARLVYSIQDFFELDQKFLEAHTEAAVEFRLSRRQLNQMTEIIRRNSGKINDLCAAEFLKGLDKAPNVPRDMIADLFAALDSKKYLRTMLIFDFAEGKNADDYFIYGGDKYIWRIIPQAGDAEEASVIIKTVEVKDIADDINLLLRDISAGGGERGDTEVDLFE